MIARVELNPPAPPPQTTQTDREADRGQGRRVCPTGCRLCHRSPGGGSAPGARMSACLYVYAYDNTSNKILLSFTFNVSDCSFSNHSRRIVVESFIYIYIYI